MHHPKWQSEYWILNFHIFFGGNEMMNKKKCYAFILKMTKSSTLSKKIRFWIVSFYQDVHAATCNFYIYDRATTFENIWYVFIEKNSIKNAIRNGCHSMENFALRGIHVEVTFV